MVLSGLDALVASDFVALKGRALGVVCNQASIDSTIEHILNLLTPLHDSGFLKVQAVFGPQHGLFGHTQDNMIEWEGSRGPNWPVYSLYGEHRQPTRAMLDGVDLLLIDLPDVGARYYTFIWTMALCMRACGGLGIPVVVLDRPNPIGGVHVEGTVLHPEFASFVGLHPLPMRPAMTIGEIANYLGRLESCEVQVQEASGWQRGMSFADTGLPWAMPSPNMPTPDTALVYPGGCLMEATNLSEGRGTTRPFEIVGAPWLDAQRFCSALNSIRLPGLKFRPIQFQPTFNKHTVEICDGCFIHVIEKSAFEPVLTFIAIMQEAIRQGGARFEWKLPPYEYEAERLPIDILAGNDWLRPAIQDLARLPEIRDRMRSECEEFAAIREASLLYGLGK
jgi:uncharacterized protein YbbC (DUF1343 family)